MKRSLFLFPVLLLLALQAFARTWTSTEGKKMEAEFIRSDGQTMTIKRTADGKVFTVPLTLFSPEDQEFVKAKIEEMKAAEAEKKAPELDLGDYEGMIKGEWVKGEHDGVNYQMFGPKEVKRSDSLPVAIYLFSGESTTVAVLFLVWSFLVSASDMVLKPLLLGRGVDAPMMVILLGAIGGLVTSGIVGLFIGAVILAVGYKLFLAWVDMNNDMPAEDTEPADQPD